MQDKPTKPAQQSPADIAREAFRRLAARRIAPTPEAYREVYEEVTGVRERNLAETILADFANSLTNSPDDIAAYSSNILRGVEARAWQSVGKQLQLLSDRHLHPPTAKTAPPATEPSSTRYAIPLVDDESPSPAKSRSIALVDDPAPDAAQLDAVAMGDAPPVDSNMSRMLREMLVRTLNFAIASLLSDAPELVKESEALASDIHQARSRQALADIEPRVKQFCFKVEMKGGDLAEERELLLRLFRLLIENIGELLEEDSWLSGQIAKVQEILSGPINYAALLDATRSLKEVIYKQSMLKHSLTEAKDRVKKLMLTVVDRLGDVADSTDKYQQKIEAYSEKISLSNGVPELNQVLSDLLQDTRTAHIDAVRSHDELITARTEVQAAESRIHDLENQLAEMSELVREDQLTGSLNRRGLDEVLEREMGRATRHHYSLCVAMLDLDDFKKLNDTHGHAVGDEALIHLVHVVKETLRSMDIIARFGGEEFMIVLPNTSLIDAMQTVTRVQRELTKRIFMHNNERLLITFSAGVAQYASGESQADMIQRADGALYQAKKAGKNRVVSAD